jgi:hypothetical protein
MDASNQLDVPTIFILQDEFLYSINCRLSGCRSHSVHGGENSYSSKNVTPDIKYVFY